MILFLCILSNNCSSSSRFVWNWLLLGKIRVFYRRERDRERELFINCFKFIGLKDISKDKKINEIVKFVEYLEVFLVLCIM